MEFEDAKTDNDGESETMGESTYAAFVMEGNVKFTDQRIPALVKYLADGMSLSLNKFLPEMDAEDLSKVIDAICTSTKKTLITMPPVNPEIKLSRTRRLISFVFKTLLLITLIMILSTVLEIVALSLELSFTPMGALRYARLWLLDRVDDIGYYLGFSLNIVSWPKKIVRKIFTVFERFFGTPVVKKAMDRVMEEYGNALLSSVTFPLAGIHGFLQGASFDIWMAASLFLIVVAFRWYGLGEYLRHLSVKLATFMTNPMSFFDFNKKRI